MAVTDITVTASYLNQDGSAGVGTVTFTLSGVMQDPVAKKIYQPKTITAALAAGAISVVLPANNDPTTTPTGLGYTVVETIGSDSRTYSVVVPYNAAGGTVDLSTLAPVTAGSGVTYSVVTGLNPALLDATRNLVAKTAAYTSADGDIVLANASSAAFTVTSPPALAGRKVTVKKTDSSANAVTFAPASGTVDGAASLAITVQYDSVDFVCDGTNWWAT